MSETNTLALKYNKAQYVVGEKMTVTLTGNVLRTSDVNLTNLQATVVLSDNSKVNIVLPSTVIKDGQIATLTGKISAIVDPSGRQWVVSPDGLSASSVA